MNARASPAPDVLAVSVPLVLRLISFHQLSPRSSAFVVGPSVSATLVPSGKVVMPVDAGKIASSRTVCVPLSDSSSSTREVETGVVKLTMRSFCVLPEMTPPGTSNHVVPVQYCSRKLAAAAAVAEPE